MIMSRLTELTKDSILNGKNNNWQIMKAQNTTDGLTRGNKFVYITISDVIGGKIYYWQFIYIIYLDFFVLPKKTQLHTFYTLPELVRIVFVLFSNSFQILVYF